MPFRFASSRAGIDAHPLARRWFSPASYGLVGATRRTIDEVAEGRVLDVGCGSMPYRRPIEALGAEYVGLDVEARTEGVSFISSATDMSTVENGTFDMVLCSEVLEHLAEPRAAITEIARVLRPRGALVLTVPFLGRLHEEPHDYFRYTEHGLRSMLGDAGFKVESIEITGSVFSLLGHQLSSAAVLAWRVPVLRWAVLALNAALVVGPARLLDACLGPVRRKLPLGYVVVARSGDAMPVRSTDSAPRAA